MQVSWKCSRCKTYLHIRPDTSDIGRPMIWRLENCFLTNFTHFGLTMIAIVSLDELRLSKSGGDGHLSVLEVDCSVIWFIKANTKWLSNIPKFWLFFQQDLQNLNMAIELKVRIVRWFLIRCIVFFCFFFRSLPWNTKRSYMHQSY